MTDAGVNAGQCERWVPACGVWIPLLDSNSNREVDRCYPPPLNNRHTAATHGGIEGKLLGISISKYAARQQQQ
jgi:hypothetical protein